MKASDFSILTAGILSFTLISSMHAQQSPEERVAEIQAALREAKLDGWLFYDFRHSDPLAYRILKLDEKMLASRRWFDYVPASGEAVKIVQSIEQFKLDSLPGRKVVFRGWQELHTRLKEELGNQARRFRVDRCGYEIDQARSSRHRRNLDGLRWRNGSGRVLTDFQNRARSTRFSDRFRAQEYPCW